MNNTLVTVITVCYNSEKFIESTIKSVLSQTYECIEFIIIDGASTDGTLDIIRKYKDSISLLISEPDNGIYDAMNKGVNKASGEWVIFMNSGDIFDSNTILEQVMTSEIDLIHQVIFGDVVLLHHDFCIPEKARSVNTIVDNMNMCHQSTLTRQALLKEYLFDTAYKISADYDLFYRIYDKLGPSAFKYLNKTISRVDCTDSLSEKSKYKRRREALIVRSRHFNFKYICDVIKYYICWLLKR